MFESHYLNKRNIFTDKNVLPASDRVTIAAVWSLSMKAAMMQATPARQLQKMSNVLRPIPSNTK
jgi:hypothetical protein